MKSLGKLHPEPPAFHGIVEQPHTMNGVNVVDPVTVNERSVPNGKVSQDDRYHSVDDQGNNIWPREVGLGMKVENILSVDTTGSKFIATVKLSYEWQLTKAEHDNFTEYDHDSVKAWRPAWEPRITFANAEKFEFKEELMVPSSSNQYHKLFDTFEHQGKVYTIVYLRIRAIFSEVYELQNFPFDCQDLTFHLESHDASKCLLKPRFKRSDFASIDLEHFTLAEWELFPPVASFLSKGSKKGRSGTCKSSEFFFLVKLKRRYEYYVSRIMLLACMLTFGSLLSWSIDVQLPHRLIVSLTILLTLITFQMAISNKLPQIRYFTIMDKYLTYSQRFMYLIALEHAALKRWFQDNEYSGYSADDLFLYSSCTLWIIFQLLSIYICICKNFLEEQKLELNRQELLVWMDQHGQGSNSETEFKICSSEGVSGEDSKKSVLTYKKRFLKQRKSKNHEQEKPEVGDVYKMSERSTR